MIPAWLDTEAVTLTCFAGLGAILLTLCGGMLYAARMLGEAARLRPSPTASPPHTPPDVHPAAAPHRLGNRPSVAIYLPLAEP